MARLTDRYGQLLEPVRPLVDARPAAGSAAARSARAAQRPAAPPRAPVRPPVPLRRGKAWAVTLLIASAVLIGALGQAGALRWPSANDVRALTGQRTSGASELTTTAPAGDTAGVSAKPKVKRAATKKKATKKRKRASTKQSSGAKHQDSQDDAPQASGQDRAAVPVDWNFCETCVEEVVPVAFECGICGQMCFDDHLICSNCGSTSPWKAHYEYVRDHWETTIFCSRCEATSPLGSTSCVECGGLFR